MHADRRTIPGLVLAVIYLGGAILLGIVLAWVLFLLTEYTYTKLLSRSILLVAAIGLIPMWRYLRLSWVEIGLDLTTRDDALAWIKYLCVPYALAILFVVPVMFFFLVVGFRVVDVDFVFFDAPFFGMLGVLFISSALVAVFEETLFRGVMFTALRRTASFTTTALVSALVYALVHFLEPADISITQVDWSTGFVRVTDAFAGLNAVPQQWDAFLCLFLLGILFAWVRERFDLWCCIALHAAWVFALRFYKELTIRDIVNIYQPWVGEYDNFTGNLVSFWLIFAFVLLALYRQWQTELRKLVR